VLVVGKVLLLTRACVVSAPFKFSVAALVEDVEFVVAVFSAAVLALLLLVLLCELGTGTEIFAFIMCTSVFG
jgi:hypothetical protein